MMLRLLAGLGIAAFFLLLLYAFHQYQAHDRTGPLRVVLGICVAAVPLGLMAWLLGPEGFVVFFLGIPLALGALHYFLAWHLPGRRKRGLICHVLRGLLMGAGWGVILLPPWLGFRWYLSWDADCLAVVEWWLASGLPLLLAGLTFAGLSMWDAHRREPKPWPAWQRRALALGLFVWACCANSYLASFIDPHRAAASESMAVIRYLSWSRPGLALQADWHGRTPLGIAAAAGRQDVVRYWSSYADRRVTGTGDAALHQVARRGDVPLAKLLLDHGADVNRRNLCDRTPLHLSAACGNAELVTLLLERGADTQAKDRNGWTPARWASAFGHDALAQRLGFALSPPPAR